MTVKFKPLMNATLISGLSSVLVACGGSGGSSTPPPPPPPPPVNNAPSVTISDVPATIREGEALSFSFAGTDPDGDALTYTLSTIAGPDFGLSVSGTNGSGTAPSVDADTAATIRVTASDGSLSANANADITIINNMAPVATLMATPNAVHEGVEITFDASGSTDAEDDSLTYSYVQIAGPSLNLEGAAEVFTTSAPEVDADSVVTLEVQVSDGRDVSIQRVDVNVTNVDQAPSLSVALDIERSLSIEGELFGIEGFVNPNDAGLVAVSDTDGGLVGLRSVEVGDDTEFVEGSTQLVTPQFERGSGPIATIFSDTFLIVESDGVTFLQQDTSNANPVLNVAGKLDIEAPCTAELTIQNSSAGSFLIIGRKGGVSLYAYSRGGESQFGFDTLTFLDSVDDGNDYCALSTGGGTFGGVGGGTFSAFFLGFDSNSFEIQRFEITDDGVGGVTLEAEERVANPALPVGNRSFVHGFRRPGFFNALAVIVADVSREGNHSVQYIIERPNSGGIGLFTGDWTLGKPTDLAFVEFDDEVTTNPDGSTTSRTGDVNDTSDDGFDGLILGYPEKREIKRFDTSDVAE